MQVKGYDPDQVRLPSGCLINGKLVPGEGEAYEVRRSSDGKMAASERGASRAQVDEAVKVADRAYRTSGWAKLHPRQRGRVLRRWADLIDANAEELAILESVTSVRLFSDARLKDVASIAEMVRYNAELADKINGEVLASDQDVFSLLIREPYGVVAGIAPWNAPMTLAVIKMAPALAAGNAIVMKPSEFTPYSLVRLAQLAIEAGVPAGMVAVVPGLGHETGHALVTHRQVSYVAFTGSTATGARVMSDAALSGCKPVALELGGKSPHLVFGDVDDLDKLADIVAGTICRNAGQVCFTGSRLVVDSKIAEPLLEKISARMRQVKPGPTWQPESTLGPIFSEAQGRRIEDILRRATDTGAEVLQGGKRIDTGLGGFYFEPTLLLARDAGNAAVMEEFFGPVLTVQPFRTPEEGMQLACHPVYGLAGAIHTSNMNTAMRAARAVQSGRLWINHYGPTGDLNAPSSPYKESGIGQDGGLGGLTKFLRTKHVRFKVQ